MESLKNLKENIKNEPFTVISNLVYKYLYNEIVMVNILPGTKINESQLANSLGISRTPVNTAIQNLIKDGLLFKAEGKQPVVSEMDISYYDNLFQARIAIESHAAFLATKNIQKKELKQLLTLLERYETLGNNIMAYGDIQAHAICDHNFHKILINASGNPFIIDMYQCIEKKILRYRHSVAYLFPQETLQHTIYNAAKHHRAIYNALQMGLSLVAQNEIEQDIEGMKDVFGKWR